MTSQAGAALLIVLLVLSFLGMLGGALLTSTTMDVWIGDRHRDEVQSLYLAETGIEEARELLRRSPFTPSQLLLSAAGADRMLSTSQHLETLQGSTDDF